MKIVVTHENAAGTEFEKTYEMTDGPLDPGPEAVRSAVSLVPDHHRVTAVQIDPDE